MSRDARGRWIAGTSGNRTGRSPGWKGISKLILAETHDGAELVEFALATFRDPNREHADRWAAAQLLLDRAIGKPLAMSEMNLAIDMPTLTLPSGYELMSVEERRRVIDMIETSAGASIAAQPTEDE